MTEKPSRQDQGPLSALSNPPVGGLPEKAEIALHGADDLYKEIRIENAPVGGSGEAVSLKEGAQVEVTIEAGPG